MDRSLLRWVNYAGMEKGADLGVTLPQNNQQMNTTAGDIILYQGRTLVIYYSKTGFAKRYASAGGGPRLPLRPLSQRDSVDLAAYDKVVFGSSVHAGGIRKLGWFKKQLPRLRGKRSGGVFHRGHAPGTQHGGPVRGPKPNGPGAKAGADFLPVGRLELPGHGPGGPVDDGGVPQDACRQERPLAGGSDGRQNGGLLL